jgi:hypothetical protein
MNIKNLFVENIVSKGKTVGGLIGLNTGKIENIHVQGNFTASNLGGGLIGKNYGQIDHCSFQGQVEACRVFIKLSGITIITGSVWCIR